MEPTQKKVSGMWIAVGVIVVLALFVFGSYNGLVIKDEGVKKAWSAVESQYQRRSDLIPNLVETVKGAANFEQTTLTQVVEARAKATSITVDPTKLDQASIAKFQAAQGELSTALGKLLAISEQYPTLTATQNFRDLQSQLEGTENRITVARKDYGDAVNTYSIALRSFPTNLIAKIFGFSERGYFQSEQGADKAPAVSF